MTEAGMILLMVQKFPAPVDVGYRYPSIHRGFKNIPGGCLGFLNHQQYHGTLQLPTSVFVSGWTAEGPDGGTGGFSSVDAEGAYIAQATGR